MKERKPLSTLRESLGLTQDEVAKVLGISGPAYCRKEKGVRPLYAGELQQLATLFGVAMDDIAFSDQDLTVLESRPDPSAGDGKFEKWVQKVRDRSPSGK